jgi:hypothetical protein
MARNHSPEPTHSLRCKAGHLFLMTASHPSLEPKQRLPQGLDDALFEDLRHAL